MGSKKAQRRRARSRRGAVCTKKQFDLAVVLVHGIGPNKPGKTLSRWSPEIEHALRGLAEPAQITAADGLLTIRGGEIRTRHIALSCPDGREHRILVTEACWSDAYRPRRLIGTLPWMARVAPALVLPFMPDSRDTAALRSPRPDTLAMAVLRFLLRLATIFIIVILLTTLPVWASLVAATLLLTIVAFSLLSRRANLAGHVLMAATDGPELKAVEDRVDDVIAACETVAAKVTVVAHSQGGFIAHRVLQRRTRAQLRLVCVGSGLRPITLLRVLGRTPYSWASAIALSGVVALSVALQTSYQPPRGGGVPDSVREEFWRSFAGLLLGGTVSRDHQPTQIDFSVAIDALPKFNFSWLLVIAVLLYISAVLSIRRWGPRFIEETRIRSLGVRSWLELTSRHDLVGRLTVPTLPQPAIEQPVVVTGNPLADHLYYFRRRNITVWLVAAQLMIALGSTVSPSVEQAREVAVMRSERRHWLRLSSICLPLLLVMFLGALFDEEWDLGRLTPLLPALALLGIATSVGVIFNEVRDSRHIAMSLPSIRAKAPRIDSGRARAADGALLYGAAILNSLASVVLLDLFGTPAASLVNTYAFWAIIQLALAIAIIAGYRPGLIMASILTLTALLHFGVVQIWWSLESATMALPFPPGVVSWVGTLLMTTIAYIGVARWWRVGLFLRNAVRRRL